jgi:hypothetical protein
MNALLRRLAQWKGRRRAAQIIVFDGGAEVETSRAFLKGAVIGIGLTTVLFLVSAPGTSDEHLLDEIERRQALVREANQRLTQAVAIADVCLSTANQLEETLASYQAFLSGRPGLLIGPPGSAR